MQFNIIQTIFLFSTFLSAIGLSVIIYSRNKENTTNRLFVLLLILVAGYIASHSIHFVFERSGNLTILDLSCHSFLLLIIVTLTFFTWNFPVPHKMGLLRSASILIPSLVFLILLWAEKLVLGSHQHFQKFEAHYSNLYPLFLIWYAILLSVNLVWSVSKIRKELKPEQKRKNLTFLIGLILTNIFSFIFGLLLPWLQGFYYLVEISPLTFLVGVIIFSAVAVSKFNLFPAAYNKVSNFSLTKKVFLSAVILVPIIILIVEIPIMTAVFKIQNNAELIKLFMISIFSGILVSTSMAFVIVKIISSPLNLLKLKAKDVEEGNYNFQITSHSNDEIGELTNAFNNMVKKLRANQAELRQQRDRIHLLLNAFDKSSVAITVVDSNFGIIDLNETFAKLISAKKTSLAGKNLIDLQLNKLDNFNEILDSIKSNKKFEGETTFKNCQSDNRHLIISATETSIQGKDKAGYLFVEVDVTEKKILENQLLKTEKLAALGEMAAVMAHEIKTPLTSIKMNADILYESLDLNDYDKNAFSIIQKEINRLNHLVKDVLGFARQTELIYSYFDFYLLIERIKKQLASKLNRKSAELINLTTKTFIEADEEKITLVLLNLIDNSLENIDKNGKIWIGSETNDNVFSIFVADNGGSNLDEEKIFEPFFTTKSTGTGLGLSISKKIIQQHNGSIKLICSKPDRTEFKIDLPLKRID